jgi:malate synthase
MAEFNKCCQQLHVTRDDVNITEQDLVEIPKGTVNRRGIRKTLMLVFYTESFKRSWRCGSL